MSKKNRFMMVVLVALAVVYVFYFTGWFKPKIIHISHISRAIRSRFDINDDYNSATVPISFRLEPQCKPTEIKVVLLAAWQTNQSVLPVWHLIAFTNAVPVEYFAYGQSIRGLKPEVPGAHAQPLQPGATYRLFVTAGSAKGQHDFQARPAKENEIN
jgi:hypothetical protein